MKNYLLFLILGFVLYSCKKNSTSNTTPVSTTPTVIYSFKCWNKKAGYITNFQSNNNTLKEHWDFGDGDTLLVTGGVNSSFGPQNHIYKAPGIYTVTLIVNNDIAHKVTQNDTIEPNFNFYYTGLPIAGDTLFFRFHAFLPAATQYSWTFGDGATSSDSTPFHIYSAAGDYVVRLTINGNPANLNLWKEISVCKDPVYTYLAANTRLWHGTRHSYGMFDSSSYNVRTTLSDSSFALQFYDQLTLGYNYTKYTYNATLSSDQVLAFTYSIPGNPTSTIYYDHIKDSIFVFSYHGFQSGPGQPPISEETTWYTP
ncbi:MAG: hypothetical protein JWQ38_1859 [Flavipsychrobacter sp.]|nr:hypothetical protein [Flavipsychrobacter sp.]